MIVFAIGALLVGGAVQGFRSLRKANLREASTQLSGAMRYLFDRASTTGKIHRLVIDIENRMYWAEVSDEAPRGCDYVLVARPGLAEPADGRGHEWLAEQVREVLGKVKE